MSTEFWAMGRPYAGGRNSPEFNAVRQAVRAEEIGYDGIVYVDSQNRYGQDDCKVAVVACHSERSEESYSQHRDPSLRSG